MEKLFLLKADFLDENFAVGKKFWCPDCVMIEGLLSYYPKLKELIEVNYIDFARPRKPIIELIGETNQSCPVLILNDGSFLNDVDAIISHFVTVHKIGESH